MNYQDQTSRQDRLKIEREINALVDERDILVKDLVLAVIAIVILIAGLLLIGK